MEDLLYVIVWLQGISLGAFCVWWVMWNRQKNNWKRVFELEQQVERARNLTVLLNSCVTCSASLYPSEAIPHCEDCLVEEEAEDVFRKELEELAPKEEE